VYSSAFGSAQPIYDRLVRERGDVPAEVRRTAEQLQEEVRRAMQFDFRRPWPGAGFPSSSGI
jgi:hypothetical protein